METLRLNINSVLVWVGFRSVKAPVIPVFRMLFSTDACWCTADVLATSLFLAERYNPKTALLG